MDDSLAGAWPQPVATNRIRKMNNKFCTIIVLGVSIKNKNKTIGLMYLYPAPLKYKTIAVYNITCEKTDTRIVESVYCFSRGYVKNTFSSVAKILGG